MSRNRSDDNRGGDVRIRRLYEAVATERTPPSLDAAVLAAARQACRSHPSRRWLQPLAVAASTVLCFGLVFQVAWEPKPADSYADPAEPGTSAVHQAAVESRARKLGELQREKAGATAAPFDDGDPGASSAPEVRESPTCSPEDRTDPAEWQTCIEALDSVGQTEQAALERASLQREYPAFDDRTE